MALVNALRGRPALALPKDVGAIELAAFVGIGGLLQLIGGQTTSAWVLCAVNVGLLLVLYVWFAYGVASILRFTGRRVGEQLAAAVDLLARAIPLLLLFSVVLFVNTEMWQVFAGMNGATARPPRRCSSSSGPPSSASACRARSSGSSVTSPPGRRCSAASGSTSASFCS